MNDKHFSCPLLRRELDESECYDIQMVRCNFMKPDILAFDINTLNAGRFCEHCGFNQLYTPVNEPTAPRVEAYA